MSETLNSQLLTKMNHLNSTMKQLRQLKNSKLSLLDPNTGQGKVLSQLKNISSLSQKELVEYLDMKPQSVSEIIQKLERKKYIVRSKIDGDKRSYEISLTDEGKKATNRLSLEESSHFDILSIEQKQQLNISLDQLISTFEEENKKAKENFGVNIFGSSKKN